MGVGGEVCVLVGRFWWRGVVLMTAVLECFWVLVATVMGCVFDCWGVDGRPVIGLGFSNGRWVCGGRS